MGFKIYSDRNGTDWINLSQALDIFFESKTVINIAGISVDVNYFDIKVGVGEGKYYV